MTEPTPEAPAAPVKPDAVPDDFWNAEEGAVKIDDFAASYADLNSQLGVLQAAREGIPESADGYEANLPEGFELPDGFEFDAGKHPSIEPLKEIAAKHGLHPSAVSEIIGLAVKSEVSQHEEHQAAMKALGETPDVRIASLSTAIRAKLGANGDQLCSGLSAFPEIVPAIEKLIAGSGPAAPQTHDQGKTDPLASLKPEDRAMARMMEGKK